MDIDDVCCDTARKLIETVFENYPVADSSPEQLWQEYHQPGHVPEWKEQEVQEYIWKLLSDHDYMSQLPPIQEMRGVLQQFVEEGGVISCYISSRLDHLQIVTQEWLEEYNFPPAQVITRPDAERRHNWKLRVLAEPGQITGLIDDNPHAFEDTEDVDVQKIWLRETNCDPATVADDVLLCTNCIELSTLILNSSV